MQQVRRSTRNTSERDRNKTQQGLINHFEAQAEWWAYTHSQQGFAGTAGVATNFAQGLGTFFDTFFSMIDSDADNVFDHAANFRVLYLRVVHLMSFKLTPERRYRVYTITDPTIGHVGFGTDMNALQTIASNVRGVGFSGIHPEITQILNWSIGQSQIQMKRWMLNQQEAEKKGDICRDPPWLDPKWTP